MAEILLSLYLLLGSLVLGYSNVLHPVGAWYLIVLAVPVWPGYLAYTVGRVLARLYLERLRVIKQIEQARNAPRDTRTG